MDNQKNLGGIVVLGLCGIFGIVVCIAGIFEQGETSIGIWSTSAGGISLDGCEITCLQAETNENDCSSAQCSKCKTLKAFSILGVLGTFTALGLAVAAGLDKFPAGGKFGSLISGVSSISYLIIFAISAANYNGEPNAESSCGNGGSDSDDTSYGAAFALAIVTWIFLIIASVVLHMGTMEAK